MTGEMTLKGKILKIGGLREKIISAYNSGVTKIFIPKDNESDMDLIPDEIKNNINIILVNNYSEIYKELFQKSSK
jgi:ATP-dependent Lon protease